MMATVEIINLGKVPEEGTTGITLSNFLDELDETAVMKTLSWTLVDIDGGVINARVDQALTPAATVSFALSGADLALSGTDSRDRKRRLTIKGTYDSTLGNNMPLTAECEFEIVAYSGIPSPAV